MRSLFRQVGLTRQGSSDLPQSQQLENEGCGVQDEDAADAMGCFASLRRLGHYGMISGVCILSYEPVKGLMAVASRGGMVKVFGGKGVELVLEEDHASGAGEDSPAHLLFPTPSLLVGVTAVGAVLSWDLETGGRSGSIPSPLDPITGLEERVTSVRSAGACTSAVDTTASDAPETRYIIMGFESGRVRIAHVVPTCRASGYTVEPRDTIAGAPEELHAPGRLNGKCLGPVTAIASFGNSKGGGFGIFGYRHGGIVIWDWVRRKRLALLSLGPPIGENEKAKRGFEGEEEEEEEEGREVTCLAVHPSGKTFAAGFASGGYAVFPTSSSSRGACPPRWVREVGDDGSIPREGPTIVRTPVSSVQWVSVRGAGVDEAWGLVVAGGVEIEEGEEPDGVSLLLPPMSASSGGVDGGGKGKKQDIVATTMAALETAVFVPFALGQERLSHVHCVVSGAEKAMAEAKSDIIPAQDLHGQGSPHAGGRFEQARLDSTEEEAQQEQESAVDVEELVVMGLVQWNEEVRGADGRLHFSPASSIQACPIQTKPYVALLQLAPEKFGPHLEGFAAVTAVASTPLLSSSMILDLMACLGKEQQGAEGRDSPHPLSLLLRGGHLRWPKSIPLCARDEGLCASELLVAGHSNGSLTFWQCCGPASRQDGISLSEGRVTMCEVPSGAVLLGFVPVTELAGDGESAAEEAVTALDLWIERDRVGAAERNACWVAVGFDSGDATVIVLSNRMEADSCGNGGGEATESVAGTPLSEKPVKVSDVHLSGEAVEPAGGGVGARGILKRIIKRDKGQRQPSPGGQGSHDTEDDELEAAIAEARAEARAIAALEEPTGVAPEEIAPAEEDGPAEPDDSVEVNKTGEEGEKHDGDRLRQELSEAMAGEGGELGDSRTSLPPDSPEGTGSREGGETGGRDVDRKAQLRLNVRGRASLTQLSLKLHSFSVRCVALSFDTRASSLALVVADAGGVVSVTDVSTGSASLLPMRVPQSIPCRPCITIGPLPSTLSGARIPNLGASGALFVLVEDWLNVFDLATRAPVDFVQVPGLAPPENDTGDGGRGHGRGDGSGRDDFLEASSLGGKKNDITWITCVEERGLPLLPYASDASSYSLGPRSASSMGDDGDRSDVEGGGGGRESCPDAVSGAQTIWVSLPPSSTALDERHENELQMFANSSSPEPLLVVVSGAMVIVLRIAQMDAGSMPSVFSRRSSQLSPNFSAFKGGSGATLVVQSRAILPQAEANTALPAVEGAGVCLVAAGHGQADEVGRRGCLITVDSSRLVNGLLLPSLCPIFRDRFPTSHDAPTLLDGTASLAQKSVCNALGEITLQGLAGELTRWSLLTDETCDALMGSKPRLVKVSGLAVPGTMSRQSSEEKRPPPRGVLGRLSLGVSRRNIADVFDAEPQPRRSDHARHTGGGGGVPAGRGRGASDGDRHQVASASAKAVQDQREALFGERDVGDRSGSARDIGGARGGLSGTHAAVSEARDLAIQRGEKLESMVDKSRQLEDSAMAFGEMAKQLRRQQEDESCCIS